MKQVTSIAFFVWLTLNSVSGQPARMVDETYTGYHLSDVNASLARNVLDTVLYPVFEDECARDAVTVGLQGWGRISGMNAFGDLEKAQMLEFTGSDVFTVIGALVFFEKPGIIGNSTVNCKVYSVNPTTGAPLAIKGFSNAVKMDEILIPESEPVATPFSFEDGVEVNLDEPKFFVSVDFSNLYASRDTLVILQTLLDCGDGGNTWELHNDGISWFPISSFSTWGINADFLITAVVDFNDPTSLDDFVASGGLKIHPVFPNPAKERMYLNFTLANASQVEINLLDSHGRNIIRKDLGFMRLGKHSCDFNISEFPAGNYFYTIKTDDGMLSSQFQISR